MLGWWAADYAYAGFWQVRSFFGRDQADDFATGDRAPIVVLAGVYETWRFLEPLIVALHERATRCTSWTRCAATSSRCRMRPTRWLTTCVRTTSPASSSSPTARAVSPGSW